MEQIQEYGFRRYLVGTFRSVGLLLVSPVYLVVLWLRERALDRSRPERFRVPVDVSEATDATAILKALMAQHDTIWAVPVADLYRAAASQQGTNLESESMKYHDRFVLESPVTFSTLSAKPIRGVPVAEGVDAIPYKFITDFASIPSLFRRLIGHPMGYYDRAAVVHDGAYASHKDRSSRGRLDCDRAMLTIMREDCVAAWRRSAIYWALRLGGGSAFRKAKINQGNFQDRLEEPALDGALSRAEMTMLVLLLTRFHQRELLGKHTLENTVKEIFSKLPRRYLCK